MSRTPPDASHSIVQGVRTDEEMALNSSTSSRGGGGGGVRGADEDDTFYPSSIDLLLCDNCRSVIASSNEVLKEHLPAAWRDQVYSYPLDLFSNGHPVYAYSATNPSTIRFDLVRLSPRVTGSGMYEDIMD